MSKHAPIPALLDPTPEMLDAFQDGFVQQLHLRHQCRFKQPHQLSDRQRESAEQAGLRSMLAALPADRSRLIAAAPGLLAALKTLVSFVETELEGDSGTPFHEALDAANEAIAKAESR